MMTGLKSIALWIGIALSIAMGLGLVACQQSTSAEERAADRPDRPPGFVVDETKAFSAEQKQSLETKLKKLKTDWGAEFYVVAVTYADPNAAGRAEALKNKWLGNWPGLVLLYDRGGNELAFSANKMSLAEDESKGLQKLFRSSAEAAARAEGEGKNLGERIVIAVEAVFPILETKLTEDAVMEERFTLTEMAVFGGVSTAVLVMVIGIWIARRTARHLTSRHVVQRHFFPTAGVEGRMGAAFGGGVVAEAELPSRRGSASR
jgi:hypothetical protein